MKILFNNKKTRFAAVLGFALFVTSGCAVVEKYRGSGEPLLEPIYDGDWVARVESYRKSQRGPAKGGASYTNWDCGNGEPFEFQFNVKEGVVTVPGTDPIAAGRVSVERTFKTSFKIDEDNSAVVKGNFEKMTGSRQNQRYDLNGCYFKFKLTKNG